MNNVNTKLNEIKKDGIEKFKFYIYPSNPEQITFYGSKDKVLTKCKLFEIDTYPSLFINSLPITPKKMELVKTCNKKKGLNENIYLFICKDDEYVVLDNLPEVTPPSIVTERFKINILKITNDYLKEYGDMISNKNPVFYDRIKGSRDFVLSNTMDKFNKENKTSFGNSSTVYIFPNEIENALKKKVKTKIISLNSSIVDIKKYLPIDIEMLCAYYDNQYILLSEDFKILKHIPTTNASTEIATEYRKLITSEFLSKYIIKKDKNMKRKDARIIFEALANSVNDGAVKLYLESNKNQK
ncbi:MAG: hypothetical protein ACI4N3_05440 [Alphaproteobacteria bacterium]